MSHGGDRLRDHRAAGQAIAAAAASDSAAHAAAPARAFRGKKSTAAAASAAATPAPQVTGRATADKRLVAVRRQAAAWIGSLVLVFSFVCLTGLFKVQSQMALATLIKVTYRRMIALQNVFGIAVRSAVIPAASYEYYSGLLTGFTNDLDTLHVEVLRELDDYGADYPELLELHFASSVCPLIIQSQCNDLYAHTGPSVDYFAELTNGLHPLLLDVVDSARSYNDANFAGFASGSASVDLQRIVGLAQNGGFQGCLKTQKYLRSYLTNKVATDQIFLTVGGVVEVVCTAAMFIGFFTSASAKVRAQREQMTLLLSTIPIEVLAAVPDLRDDIYGVGGLTREGTDDLGMD
jgi:hypothetical protein